MSPDRIGTANFSADDFYLHITYVKTKQTQTI